MRVILQDVRFALRTLRRAPGFTAVAVLTLSLGIGATTTTFSVVSRVLLRPLPFPDAAQLVRVEAHYKAMGARDVGLSVPELDDLQGATSIFEAVSATYPADGALSGGERAARVEILATSVNYFTLLGVKPQLGRLFGPEDVRDGFAEAVVISDSLWRRSFGADPAIVGRRVRVDNDAYTIVGVTAPGFHHPGPTVGSDTDLWATAGFRANPFSAPRREVRALPGAIARLRGGLRVSAAQQALDAMTSRWRTQYAGAYPERQGWTLELVPVQESLVGGVRPTLRLLMAAALLILLIACVNVANLSLIRALARQREMAARAAIGADRGQVARLLLIESLVLAALSAALGLAVAAWSLPLVLRLAPARLPRLDEIAVGWDAVAFTFLTALATGVMFGMVPALRTAGIDPAAVLKEGGRIAGGTRHTGLRRAFVVAELALSLVLLVGAGLLLRTFWHLTHVDPGFRPDHLAVASIWMPVPNDPKTDRYATVAQRSQYVRNALQDVSAIPGVESAAMSTLLPLGGRTNRVAVLPEGLDKTAPPLTAELIGVTPGYFHALGARLVSGRDVGDDDRDGHTLVVIIDRTTAERCWHGADPVGRRLLGPRGRAFVVIGVVADIKHDGLDVDAVPHLYASMYQVNGKVLSVVARAKGNVMPTNELQRALERLDAEVPTFGVTTLGNVLAASLAPRRFAATSVLFFAAIATLLAAIGLYGVISYGIKQRSHELGVRVALGARPADLVRLLVGESGRLVVAGVAGGVALAALFARGMSTLLYGVATHDVTVFGAAVGLLSSVGLLAAAVPARRAARIDPVIALRIE